MPDLHDKVAIITGASSGIGAATAAYFAELGCRMVISGRSAESLEATKQKCLQAGCQENNVLVVVADITKENDAKKLLDETLSHFGRLNILVNSAGIVVLGSVADSCLEEYDRVMDVNTKSVVRLTRLCIPHLVASKGAVVNVSSINGPCSFPGVTYYCMSKAALDQFTKCLALELAKDGVRVNAVNPGVIVTDVHRRAGLDEEKYRKFLEHSRTTHAMGRVGQAVEVARAIAFLASDDASFTTGHLLRIDGGRGIMAPR